MKPSVLDATAFQTFIKKYKLQPFRVKQIIHEIFKNQNISFAEMTTLSKELRQQLDENFSLLSFQVDNIIEDKTSTKISFKTHDGYIIETVILHHRQHEKYAKNSTPKLNRITLCVSSQIGCPIGCLFCVT
jgi:23S rRNA (adenine2503-C2)-methyltransferase